MGEQNAAFTFTCYWVSLKKTERDSNQASMTSLNRICFKLRDHVILWWFSIIRSIVHMAFNFYSFPNFPSSSSLFISGSVSPQVFASYFYRECWGGDIRPRFITTQIAMHVWSRSPSREYQCCLIYRLFIKIPFGEKKKGIHGEFRIQTTSRFLVLVEVTTVADIGQGFSLVR